MSSSGTRAYQVPGDMHVFDEIETAVWVASYHPQKVHFLWCNQASVQMWNKKDRESFINTDISSNRSEAVVKLHEELYDIVQVQKKVNVCRRTMYPQGKALTVDCTFAPFLIINERGVEEHVSIVTARPVQGMDECQVEANRAVEMLRHTPIQTAMYSATGVHIQSNVTARNYYAGLQDNMTLEKITRSCVFEEGDGAGEEDHATLLLERVKALRLGDDAIKMEVKKVPMWRMKEIHGQGAPSSRSDSMDGISHSSEQKDEVRWHEISFIPTVDPGTGDPAIMVIENNITELENMKRAEAQMKLSARQQEQFIAAVSHELRTPLNGIIGLSEYLIEEDVEDQDPHETKKTLEIILQSAQRLNLLINDILDSAALKEGTMQIRQGKVDVNEAIAQVCRQLAVLSNPGVELQNHDDLSLPLVRGDQQRVCQILTNLIGNSLKFTHDGTVEVFTAVVNDDWIRVTVKDTGIGIAPGDIERMFLPFEQADMSAQRTYEGTGLGLSLVRQLIDGHGGKMSVESQVGQGTSMSFTLPVFVGDDQENTNSLAKRARSRSNSMPSPAGGLVAGNRSPASLKGKMSNPSSRRGSAQDMQSLEATVKKLQADLDLLSKENQVCREMLRSNGLNPPLPGGKMFADEAKDAKQLGTQPQAAGENWQMAQMKVLLTQAANEKKEALQELEETCTLLEEKLAAMSKLEKEIKLLRASLSTMTKEKEKLEAANNQLLQDLNAPGRVKETPSFLGKPSDSSNLDIQLDIRAITVETASDSENISSDSDGHDGTKLAAKSKPSPLKPLMEDETHPHMLTHRQLYGQTEILSVDDTPLNHLVIERILKRTDYKMSSCLNGMSALKLLEDRGYLPDMILLDVMMPGMSGFEVCHALRQKYPGASTPIIMISAKSNPENILQGFSSGCIDYVCKPFSRHELLARINAHLRQVELVSESSASRMKGKLANSMEIGNENSTVDSEGTSGCPPAGKRSNPSAASPLLPEFLRNSASHAAPTQAPIVDTIPSATVLVADVVNYELISSLMAADLLYQTLQELFVQVDSIAEKRSLIRVEHDGDYIMLVGNGDFHADTCLQAGLDMLSAVRMIRSSNTAARRLGIAVGLQSGPVYTHSDKTEQSTSSAVVYFGQTVSEARELEARGSSMTISIGQATAQALTPDKHRLEVWKWQHPWQRHLLAHEMCDWESALQSTGKQGSGGPTVTLDGESDVQKIKASTVKSPVDAMVSTRKGGKNRSRKILLQLQYDTEKQKVSSLQSEVLKLRSQLQNLTLESVIQASPTPSTSAEAPAAPAVQPALPSAPVEIESHGGEEHRVELARHAQLAADFRLEMDHKMQSALAQVGALEARLRAAEQRGDDAKGDASSRGRERQLEAMTALLERQIEEVRKERGVVGAELVAIQKENESLRQERNSLLIRARELEMDHQSAQREKALIAQEKDQLLHERSEMRTRVRELERDNSLAMSTILNSSIAGGTNASFAASRGVSMSPAKSPAGAPQPVRPGVSTPTGEGGSLADEVRQLKQGMIQVMALQHQPIPASPAGTADSLLKEREVSGTARSNFTVQEGEGGKLVITDAAGRRLRLVDFAHDGDAVRRGLSELLGRYGVLARPIRLEVNHRGRFTAIVEYSTEQQALQALQGFDGATYNGEHVTCEYF